MDPTLKRWEKPIVDYLRTLLSGKFADAERLLVRLEKRAKTPEERRIVYALRGVYSAYQSDDRESLIYRLFLAPNPKDYVDEVRDRLKSHLTTLGDDSDPYYYVWRVILDNFQKLPVPHRLRSEAGSVD